MSTRSQPGTERTKLITSASGFLIGAFSFLRCIDRITSSGWTWLWLTIFLAGIGLLGISPTARVSAGMSLAMGPFITSLGLFISQVLKDPTCCNLWPLGLGFVLFVAASAAFAAVAGARFLRFFPVPRSAYFVALGVGLCFTAFAPEIEKARELRRWQNYAASCSSAFGRPGEVYRDVCKYHDQFDSVLACQLGSGEATSAIRKAGRAAVNAYMSSKKPANCQ